MISNWLIKASIVLINVNKSLLNKIQSTTLTVPVNIPFFLTVSVSYSRSVSLLLQRAFCWFIYPVLVD